MRIAFGRVLPYFLAVLHSQSDNAASLPWDAVFEPYKEETKFRRRARATNLPSRRR